MKFEIWKYKRENREFLKNFKSTDFWASWQKIRPVQDRIIFDFALLEYRAENSNENRKRNLRKIYKHLQKICKTVKAPLKLA